MKTRMAWTVAAAALWLAAPAAAEDFQWHGKVAAGKTVEIKGVNGAIDATAAGGDEVEVTATKRARRSDPGSVRIEVVEHAEGVTICAVYPDVDGRRNRCAPGDRGSMNTRDNDVDVHFTVRVPRGVAFAPRTVNGDVEAEGLEGDVSIRTVNGSIQVSTSGRAEAQTVNGSIRASAGRADWEGDAEFKTVNGSITVTLPSSMAAEVKAETVNGTIDTDFPLELSGGLKLAGGRMRRLSGTIGGGGRSLEMETVNGSIHLKKS
jgi:Putative adhesin